MKILQIELEIKGMRLPKKVIFPSILFVEYEFGKVDTKFRTSQIHITPIVLEEKLIS